MVNPLRGTINETNFTIYIVNWQSSNKPIKYKVWATGDINGTNITRALSADWIADTQGFRFQA